MLMKPITRRGASRWNAILVSIRIAGINDRVSKRDRTAKEHGRVVGELYAIMPEGNSWVRPHDFPDTIANKTNGHTDHRVRQIPDLADQIERTGRHTAENAAATGCGRRLNIGIPRSACVVWAYNAAWCDSVDVGDAFQMRLRGLRRQNRARLGRAGQKNPRCGF